MLDNELMVSYLAGKPDLVAKYRLHDKDSGSVFVQVSLLCARIDYLSRHVGLNRKDYAASRSLMKMIHRRRKLLKGAFLQSRDLYRKIIQDFGLRDVMEKASKVSSPSPLVVQETVVDGN